MIEFYFYIEKKNLRFSIIVINLLIHRIIEVNVRQNNEKDQKPLTDPFHHL